jgi:hypothetical protein
VRLRIKDIPPARLEDFRRCATSCDGEAIEIDHRSPCYKALFTRRPPKLPLATEEQIAEGFERDKLGGCGCGR